MAFRKGAIITTAVQTKKVIPKGNTLLVSDNTDSDDSVQSIPKTVKKLKCKTKFSKNVSDIKSNKNY